MYLSWWFKLITQPQHGGKTNIGAFAHWVRTMHRNHGCSWTPVSVLLSAQQVLPIYHLHWSALMTDGRYGWGRQIASSSAWLHRHVQAAQTARVFSGPTGIFDILFPLINKDYSDSSVIQELQWSGRIGRSHEHEINLSCNKRKHTNVSIIGSFQCLSDQCLTT